MTKEEKYEAVVRKYAKELYNYCYFHLSRDKELADETFNDVLLIFYKKFDKLEIGDNIRAWLYRAADNCIKDSLSKKSKYYQRNKFIEECSDELEKGVHYDSYFEEELASEHKTKQQAEKVKQALPEEYRELFEYRYIKKKTLNEIVHITGIPYSSVRLRLNKTEALAREIIKKFFENS